MQWLRPSPKSCKEHISTMSSSSRRPQEPVQHALFLSVSGYNIPLYENKEPSDVLGLNCSDQSRRHKTPLGSKSLDFLTKMQDWLLCSPPPPGIRRWLRISTRDVWWNGRAKYTVPMSCFSTERSSMTHLFRHFYRGFAGKKCTTKR